MRVLLNGCVCGGSYDQPNPDCERCDLIRLAAELINDVFDRSRRRIDDEIAADQIAVAYDLELAEVRRIVGLPPATAESPI
jgi:hypothetical protein